MGHHTVTLTKRSSPGVAVGDTSRPRFSFTMLTSWSYGISEPGMPEQHVLTSNVLLSLTEIVQDTTRPNSRIGTWPLPHFEIDQCDFLGHIPFISHTV